MPAHWKRRLGGPFGAVLLAAAMVVPGCMAQHEPPVLPRATSPAAIDGTLTFHDEDGKVLSSITIEIAETLETQTTGLMHRKTLHPTHGMLFIFDVPEIKSFWMDQTYIPLDLIFVDADKQIVHIIENTTPHSKEGMSSREPVLYTVEVNAGFVKRFGLHNAYSIHWERK